MTDKLTAAQRAEVWRMIGHAIDLQAPNWSQRIYALSVETDEAARREAGETKRTCGPEVFDAALKSLAEKYDAPPPPADDLVERLWARAKRNCTGLDPAELLEGEAAAAIEALRAERDAHKQRGDNHWETLRSIREIARTSGDLERIIQWVSDAGQGYTESAETTLSKEMDARKSAEARVAALEGVIRRVVHDPYYDQLDAETQFAIDNALAAGGGNGK